MATSDPTASKSIRWGTGVERGMVLGVFSDSGWRGRQGKFLGVRPLPFRRGLGACVWGWGGMAGAFQAAANHPQLPGDSVFV
jgi:hypothetical protein